MTKISVVIPVYNAESTLKKCLKSVLENDYPNFEVIVVNDKSNDRSKSIVNEFEDKRLAYYENKVNSGASYSRNTGIKKAAGEIVILLDSDSYVDKNWISLHAKAHDDIPADFIGGGIIGIHKTVFGKCDAFCNWWTSIPFSKNYYLKKLHLPTNNLSVKKTVFQKIGYFNEELRIGGEDAEFCFRALNEGLKIYFKSDLIVYHYDRDDYSGYIKHQENWGRHAVKMRKGRKMDYSFLMPDSYAKACLYVLPLAILYTAFIVERWVKYRPTVLLYSPLIFAGKISQTMAIKDSFKK